MSNGELGDRSKARSPCVFRLGADAQSFFSSPSISTVQPAGSESKVSFDHCSR
jgi:hypothetical protein